MTARIKEKLVVEKGIPLPTFRVRNRPYLYPWREMEVGDSILIKTNKHTDLGVRTVATIRTSCSRYGKENKQKFSALLTDDGIRVWRTE